jgi:hypothetical protein
LNCLQRTRVQSPVMLVAFVGDAEERSSDNHTLPVKRPGDFVDFERDPLIVPQCHEFIALGCSAKEPSIAIDVVNRPDVYLVMERKSNPSDMIALEQRVDRSFRQITKYWSAWLSHHCAIYELVMILRFQELRPRQA